MPIERTLSIVKPDGVGRNLIGDVYRRFEQAGLRVVAARMMHLSQAEAEGFYAVHRERPFFKDLVRFMTSGPVMVQVLGSSHRMTTARHRFQLIQMEPVSERVKAVTLKVAVIVVDVLELVDIDHEQRDRRERTAVGENLARDVDERPAREGRARPERRSRPG